MTTQTPKRRLPPNHQVVYDVVRSQAPGIHASVGDIFAAARRRKPGLGYSTVYRALDRLRDLGFILQLHIPGTNAAVYEPARAGHAHFVCRLCGMIEDIDCDLANNEIALAVKAGHAEIHAIAMTVHGRCRACVTLAR